MWVRVNFSNHFFPVSLPERVAALQNAFNEMVRNPEYLAEAERMRLEISPLTGDQAAALIRDVYSTPAPIVKRARAMIRH